MPVEILESRASAGLLTVLRNRETDQAQFVASADRLCHLLAEEALGLLPRQARKLTSPCGPFEGTVAARPSGAICLVDIMRSGAILMEAVRRLVPEAKTAKILIQRDEETALPALLYSKLPPNMAHYDVVLCDPMLATGGSALAAIGVLKGSGVAEERIIFANVVAAPEGLAALEAAAPRVRVLTCAVDEGLNEVKYIVPGLGDFGDRYYGTHGYDEGLWGPPNVAANDPGSSSPPPRPKKNEESR